MYVDEEDANGVPRPKARAKQNWGLNFGGVPLHFTGPQMMHWQTMYQVFQALTNVRIQASTNHLEVKMFS